MKRSLPVEGEKGTFPLRKHKGRLEAALLLRGMTKVYIPVNTAAADAREGDLWTGEVLECTGHAPGKIEFFSIHLVRKIRDGETWAALRVAAQERSAAQERQAYARRKLAQELGYPSEWHLREELSLDEIDELAQEYF